MVAREKMNGFTRVWYGAASTCAGEVIVLLAAVVLVIGPFVWFFTVVPVCLAYSTGDFASQLRAAAIYGGICGAGWFAVHLTSVFVARAHVLGCAALGIGNSNSFAAFWAEIYIPIHTEAAIVVFGIGMVITAAMVAALRITPTYDAVGLVMAAATCIAVAAGIVAAVVWLWREARRRAALIPQ